MALDEAAPATCRFVCISAEDLDVSTPEFDSHGRLRQKRRHHPKSRFGCLACKKRKVKCDETLPSCHNCLKRKELCVFPNIQPAKCLKKPGPNHAELERPFGKCLSANVNLLHMKLLHHFESVTAETLIFDTKIWREKVVSLSFQYEFLMHAILLISATHLSYLLPADITYQKASALHLSRTLSLFRAALSNPIDCINADAFMATSTLLMHHAWINLDPLIPSCCHSDEDSTSQQALSLDLSLDPLFSLSPGMRDIWMGAINKPFFGSSFFATSAAHRPRESISQATSAGAKRKLESYFCSGYEQMQQRARPLASASSIYHSCPPNFCANDQVATGDTGMDLDVGAEETLVGYTDASQRLSLVLALLLRRSSGFEEFPNLGRPAIKGGQFVGSLFPPLTDVARYFFSFPTRCMPSFVSLVQANDTRALLLLFYFYRSAQILLPRKHCWWSYSRVKVLGNAIRRKLEAAAEDLLAEGERLLGWNAE